MFRNGVKLRLSPRKRANNSCHAMLDNEHMDVFVLNQSGCLGRLGGSKNPQRTIISLSQMLGIMRENTGKEFVSLAGNLLKILRIEHPLLGTTLLKSLTFTGRATSAASRCAAF
jgi:hypothetical protein